MVRALSVSVVMLLVVLPLLAMLPALKLPPTLDWSVWAQPLAQTLAVTLFSAFSVMWLALTLAPKISDSRWFNSLSVVLATPHVAFAVGVTLLLSPTGYFVRVVEAMTGLLPSPPAGWPLPEKSLLTLTLVLVLNELPFMLLMVGLQLKQLPYQRWLRQAQSMGWSLQRGWWTLVVPELLSRLKLPLAAIIIYTVSVVDIPLLLGPNTPGVLAMVVFEQHYQWGSESDASQGVWLLIGTAALVLLIMSLAVRGYRQLAARWRRGMVKAARDTHVARMGDGASRALLVVLVGLSLLVVVILIVQSLAGSWFYPALSPATWQPQRWLSEWPYIAPLLWDTLWLGLLSALVSVVAAVVVLERQRQRRQKGLKVLPLLMLLVPQLVLVLGWQRLVGQGSDGPLVLWAHVAFGFPYAYLVLHGSWVNVSERWLYQAQSLGYSYRRAWFSLLPAMLRGPLMVAFAMAFSVSIAQYLPTLWLAGGTVPTLTTEAVSIAAGGDWRLTAVYALMQALLPLTLFTLVLWRQRRQRGAHVSY